MAALAADPPRWPERTDAVSLLALNLTIGRPPLAALLPSQRVRLEILDYPGEWLLDLPLLRTSFSEWSDTTIRRLELRSEARPFLAFTTALPANAAASESLAATGHRLYCDLLQTFRDAGLSLLQPGRFLMPAPGPEPPWMAFFPHRGAGGLVGLLARRYDRYVEAIRDDLVSPLFGSVDRLVVLSDLLSALHAGPAAFADARAALAAAAGALQRRRSWAEWLAPIARLRLPPPGIGRIAFVATKSDHVGSRQRANLAQLLRALTEQEGQGTLPTAYLAIAAIACTEDATWTLEGRPVSAVRGRMPGKGLAMSYPGEIPATPPDDAFWAHSFYSLPEFEPKRLPDAGRSGIPNLALDDLLTFLLADLL